VSTITPSRADVGEQLAPASIVKVDFDSRSGDWHSLDLDTNEEEQRELNLANEADWSWVITRLSFARATP
jgi:hypothetical protein